MAMLNKAAAKSLGLCKYTVAPRWKASLMAITAGRSIFSSDSLSMNMSSTFSGIEEAVTGSRYSVIPFRRSITFCVTSSKLLPKMAAFLTMVVSMTSSVGSGSISSISAPLALSSSLSSTAHDVKKKEVNKTIPPIAKIDLSVLFIVLLYYLVIVLFSKIGRSMVDYSFFFECKGNMFV